MIKNVVFDIGNVLAGFVWKDFYESFGFSQEINEKLANATVRSALWNELDRGKMNCLPGLLQMIRPLKRRSAWCLRILPI